MSGLGQRAGNFNQVCAQDIRVGVQLTRARLSVRFLPFSRRSLGDRKAFDQTWKKERKERKEEDPTANGGFAGREWKFELSGLGRKAIEKGVENTPLDKVYIITCRSFFGADFLHLQQKPRKPAAAPLFCGLQFSPKTLSVPQLYVNFEFFPRVGINSLLYF
jgi:hypothetical protein